MAKRRAPKDDREIMLGRRSKYRPKNRERPIQIYMTDEGFQALERGCERMGLSRPDFIERLVRQSDSNVRGVEA